MKDEIYKKAKEVLYKHTCCMNPYKKDEIIDAMLEFANLQPVPVPLRREDAKIHKALNLAQAEIRALYKRMGYNDSNVLTLIDEAMSALTSQEVESPAVASDVERDPKMIDGTYLQMGCIDPIKDLWANINCENHIDPSTCKRELSCAICDKYKWNNLAPSGGGEKPSPSEITDEEIEKWGKSMEDDLYERSHSPEEVRMIIRNRIFGAKALRDNKIRKTK